MPAPLQTGTLLVATPALESLAFDRAVVLITHYSETDITMGLVINQPLGKRIQRYATDSLQQLAGGEDACAELGRIFYQGGPVHQRYLFFLHRLDGLVEGGTKILDGLYLGGNLDTKYAEADILQPAAPRLRFYLGYAGWEPGQLESEISAGTWFLAPGDPQLVLASTPETMWQAVLHSMGGKYRPISVFPQDPSVN